MINNTRFELSGYIRILKEVASEYPGKTIDNIIQQMESRLNEVVRKETI